jgi:hypothetical protein
MERPASWMARLLRRRAESEEMAEPERPSAPLASSSGTSVNASDKLQPRALDPGMPVKRPVHWLAFLWGLSMGLFGGPAAAVTGLDTTIVTATCGIRGASGTTFFECSSAHGTDRGFQAIVQPGETAFVSATLRYSYSDEGLALEHPATIQLNSRGTLTRQTDHEVGVIYFNSNLCQDIICGLATPPWILTGGVGFPPLVLGENDTPDAVTADIELSSFVSVASSAPSAFQGFVFVDYLGVTFSGVAAVPEPGSWLLLVAGLWGLGLVPSCARVGEARSTCG